MIYMIDPSNYRKWDVAVSFMKSNHSQSLLARTKSRESLNRQTGTGFDSPHADNFVSNLQKHTPARRSD